SALYHRVSGLLQSDRPRFLRVCGQVSRHLVLGDGSHPALVFRVSCKHVACGGLQRVFGVFAL
ncbi:hypothetical protein PanWU01x14_366270, partial [Parasponia andersonii]